MLFISKFEEHSMRIIDSPYRRYYIILNPSQLDSLIGDPNMKLIFINHSEEFNHTLDVSARVGEVNMLFEAMMKEYKNPEAYSNLALADYFRLIMILCCRIKTKQYPMPDTKIGHAIIDVQKYIDLHFTEDIRVDVLAERFFINASHLSHTFHKLTGNSPKQYIMRCRISYAKELLLNTNLSVAEIGVRCGFGDVSNFIRSFKKETSETPFRYRSMNKP